jgi:hypothetical protein
VRFPTRHVVAIAVALWCLTGAEQSLRAQASGLSLTVTPSSKQLQPDGSATKRRSAKTRAERNEQKQLTVTVRNFSNKAYDGLVLRYYFFAENVESEEIVIVGTGEERFNLAPNKVTQIETKPVTLHYTQPYQKKSKGKIVVMPAAGSKYEGFGVQLWFGQAVVAEKFEPVGLKKQLATAWIQIEPPKKTRKKDAE